MCRSVWKKNWLSATTARFWNSAAGILSFAATRALARSAQTPDVPYWAWKTFSLWICSCAQVVLWCWKQEHIFPKHREVHCCVRYLWIQNREISPSFKPAGSICGQVCVHRVYSDYKPTWSIFIWSPSSDISSPVIEHQWSPGCIKLDRDYRWIQSCSACVSGLCWDSQLLVWLCNTEVSWYLKEIQ